MSGALTPRTQRSSPAQGGTVSRWLSCRAVRGLRRDWRHQGQARGGRPETLSLRRHLQTGPLAPGQPASGRAGRDVQCEQAIHAVPGALLGAQCSPCPPERLPFTSSGGSRQGLCVGRGAKCLRWGVTGRLSKGNLGLYVFVRLRGSLSGEVFCGLLLLVHFEVTDAGIRL